MRYTVDQALCAGHGQCFAIAPDVLGPDDEGLNRDVGRTVDAEDQYRRQVDSAARGCPEQAIRVLAASTP